VWLPPWFFWTLRTFFLLPCAFCYEKALFVISFPWLSITYSDCTPLKVYAIIVESPFASRFYSCGPFLIVGTVSCLRRNKRLPEVAPRRNMLFLTPPRRSAIIFWAFHTRRFLKERVRIPPRTHSPFKTRPPLFFFLPHHPSTVITYMDFRNPHPLLRRPRPFRPVSFSGCFSFV